MSRKTEGVLGGLLLITGAVIGAATALLIKENRPKEPSLVLEKVKSQLNHLGEIQGSWIDYDPIEYELFESLPLVYVGGLTIAESDQVNHYQFTADVYTGDVIDYYIMEILD